MLVLNVGAAGAAVESGYRLAQVAATVTAVF